LKAIKSYPSFLKNRPSKGHTHFIYCRVRRGVLIGIPPIKIYAPQAILIARKIVMAARREKLKKFLLLSMTFRSVRALREASLLKSRNTAEIANFEFIKYKTQHRRGIFC